MDRLILFRHGKAEAYAPSGDDFDRRLAPRGEEDAAAAGRRLAELGYAPDLVLVSDAERTRGTWAAASQAVGEPEVRFEADLYHADSATIRRIAEQAGEGFGTVWVVGHNPGLHELTLRLMLEADAPPELLARARREFPTSTVAVFGFEDGRPKALDFLPPERRG